MCRKMTYTLVVVIETGINESKRGSHPIRGRDIFRLLAAAARLAKAHNRKVHASVLNSDGASYRIHPKTHRLEKQEFPF